MKNLPENELLSAYLDGEVTAAEEAEVERLLAVSPAARQRLEELRALSARLQAMPQYKLGEDLSERVLRLAERRILTQPAPTQPSPQPATPPRASLLRRLVTSRALVWSALAAAIAVMFMLNERGQQGRPAGERVVRLPEMGAKAGRGPSIQAAPETVADAEEAKRRAHRREAAPSNGRGILADDAADRTAAKELAGARTAKGGLGRPSATYSGNEFGGEKDAAMGLEPAVQSLGQVADTDRGQGVAVQKPNRGVPESPRAVESKVGMAPAGDLVAAREGEPPVMIRGRAQYGHGTFELEKILQRAERTGGYAVVCCRISPEAVRKQAFDYVLGRNGIALAEGQAASADAEKAVADALRQRLTAGWAYEDKKHLVKGLPPDGDVADSGQLDVVLVKATPAQIENTLDDLSQWTSEFLTLCVDPAPGVEEQSHWTRYNRDEARRKPAKGRETHAKRTDFAVTEAATLPKLAAERDLGGGDHRGRLPAVAQRFRIDEKDFYAQLGPAAQYQGGRLLSIFRRQNTPAAAASSAPPEKPPPGGTRVINGGVAGKGLLDETREIDRTAGTSGPAASESSIPSDPAFQAPAKTRPTGESGRGGAAGEAADRPGPSRPTQRPAPLPPAEPPATSQPATPAEKDDAMKVAASNGTPAAAPKGPSSEAAGPGQARAGDFSAGGRWSQGPDADAVAGSGQSKLGGKMSEQRRPEGLKREPGPLPQTYPVFFVLQVARPGNLDFPTAASMIRAEAAEASAGELVPSEPAVEPPAADASVEMK